MSEIGSEGDELYSKENPGRHRALTSGLQRADIRETLDRFGRYKERYISVVENLAGTQEGPFTPTIARRAHMIRDLPILINRDRSNFFDPETGEVYVNSMDPMTRDHEVMHPLLYPGFDWTLWNEGFVNKAAGFVHAKMGIPNKGKHAGADPSLNYTLNEELIDQYMRITGVSFRRIIEIGTYPVGEHENLPQIMSSANENPDLLQKQREYNMDFFNTPVIVGGRMVRLIDYGKKVEGDEMVKRFTPGKLISEVDRIAKREAITRAVVEVFKKIEPIAATA